MSERPLSPHLQVYKPQLTSILSITHRATGVFLSVGALFVVYWLYAVAKGPESLAVAQGVAASLPGQLVLLGMTFSVFFHLANGLRHLAWDAGWGLELKQAYQSGWLVVIFSLIATVLCWLVIIGGQS